MLNTVKKNNKNFLMQGSILALAGLLVRFIGLIYRIPMISIIGTEGNGYYTSAYSIYSLFLIISSYSFPSAISKLISYRLANDRYLDVKRIIFLSFILAFIIGSIMFSLMHFGARYIALILKKEKLFYVLRVLAPTLFIMAFLSVFRGIFQGMGNMVPTAISQIIEQIFNAIFSVFLAKVLFDRGLIANLIYETTDFEYSFGAMGGAIGTGVGAFCALVFFIFLFINYFKIYKRILNQNNKYEVQNYNSIIFNMFSIIVPILFSATIFNISEVVDDIIFSNAYTLLNRNDEIIYTWGVYGNYHLLFNIPVAMANALSSSIIPSLSHSVAMRDGKEVVMKIKSSLKFTTLLVIPACIGLFVLSDPICHLLFPSKYTDLLINVVSIGSIAVITYSLSSVSISILQGLGHFNLPVINSFIALIIHTIVLVILLLFAKLGIYSIIISNIIFSLIVFILNKKSIDRKVKYRKNLFKNIILPFIISIVMGIIIKILYMFLNNTFLSGYNVILLSIKLIICISVAIMIYLALIISCGLISYRDSEYFPLISKFIKA